MPLKPRNETATSDAAISVIGRPLQEIRHVAQLEALTHTGENAPLQP